MVAFDPDAAAQPDSGLFGLHCTEDESECVLVPVPFDATTSYRNGARHGPDAIRRASLQVDLFDPQFGRTYERGLFLQEADPRIAELQRKAREAAEPLIEKGGAEEGDADRVAVVDGASAEVSAIVEARVAAILAAGKLPGVVGGDHSVPLGAFRAVARSAGPFGVLHIDAHADLRVAFEGFRESHASILHNVLGQVDEVEHVVQVGIRDFGEREHRAILDSEGRVRTFFDLDWRRRFADGEALTKLCEEVVSTLPEQVWITWDIDGLDPSLCPNTGTPVPGGLLWHEAMALLEALTRAGIRILGFDLCEVNPGEAIGEDDLDSWDANVGARLLYKLCGAALMTR